MLINTQNKNRLLVYFFYDGQGIVDSYAFHILKAMQKNVKDTIFVCNGKLGAEYEPKVRECVSELLIRENKGFDGWAYKSALDFYGWDKLCEYDEILLMNHTIMGPVNSFDEMFADMDSRDLDFWGITKNFKFDEDPFGLCKYGYLPEHIQSHFIAVRQSLVKDKRFQSYWDNFPEITSYGEAICYHEAIFTKDFEELGFKWDVYVNVDSMEGCIWNPIMSDPATLIAERKCPIFKRRSFFQGYENMIDTSIGDASKNLYDYIVKSGCYDVNMIWDNILRSCNQYDIYKCLNHNYILSSKFADTTKDYSGVKVALVLHLYFESLFDKMYEYASHMPAFADVYITTGTEEKKKAIEARFADLKVNKLEVRVVENRGRDVSAFLVGAADIVDKYDYICFAHDKKTVQLASELTGRGFADKCFNNILYSSEFVLNVIDLFETNDRLGILSPAFPNHGEYFGCYANEWSMNYENTVKLAKELGLTVPMSHDKPAIAPYGSVFWVRAKAIKGLYDKKWKYTDFPKEPLPVDGTISHAIERVRPFVVQQAGYYPAVVFSDDFAALEYSNVEFYLRQFQSVIRYYGNMGTLYDEKMQLINALTNMSSNSGELSLIQSYGGVQSLCDQIANLKKERREVDAYVAELEKRAAHESIFHRIKRNGLIGFIKKVFKAIFKKK